MTSVDPIIRRLDAMTQCDPNVNANRPPFDDTVSPTARVSPVALEAASDSRDQMLSYKENTIVHELHSSAKKPFHRWRTGRNQNEEVQMTALKE